MNYEKKIRTIFIGTPDFAVPSLEALANDDSLDIVLVITKPDAPQGRKKTVEPPAVKIAAANLKLAIAQPVKINDLAADIKKLRPDLIVVTAYAQLIPEEILNIPQYGCLNVHGSLLPKYRGAAVIQAAILHGDQETGVTIIKMDKTLDTGPILAQATMAIEDSDNADTLSEKLSHLGARLLVDTAKKYIRGEIKPWPQDNAQVSYVKILKKADGLLDWSKPAAVNERFVRAMTSWPTAWTWWQGKQIKILAVQHQTLSINSYKPGKTFIYNKGLAVQCGQDSLIIKKLQLEGKKALASQEFIRGHVEFVGSILS